ncbi:MAG: hypothetical protein QGG64_20805, partial [Candidatus Latescibacteria bacterium]|nr:hypothetical protein [Candidatus Latescibacterota bacterium]
ETLLRAQRPLLQTKHLQDLWPDEEAQKTLLAAAPTAECNDLDLHPISGAIVPVDVRACKIDYGEIEAIYLLIRDVTQTRRAHEEVLEANRKLRELDQLKTDFINTRIDGRWSIGKNAVISLHASLPTGKRSLNVPDANTVGILARNDLGFPVRTFGQGLDLGGTLSVARHRGHWSMSAGIRVIRKGAYTPLAGATTYKPGDEVSGLIGIDYTYKRWIFQLNAAGSFYKMDRQGGTIAFRNGKQFLFQTGIFYMGRVFRLQAQLFEITRLKNLNISNGHPLYETRDSNGNDLRARFEASLTPVRPFTLFIIGNAKYLTSNAHTPGTALYRGDAHLLEGGGGFSLSLGTTQLSVRATQLTGKTEDNTVKLSAFNIRAALRFAL